MTEVDQNVDLSLSPLGGPSTETDGDLTGLALRRLWEGIVPKHPNPHVIPACFSSKLVFPEAQSGPCGAGLALSAVGNGTRLASERHRNDKT